MKLTRRRVVAGLGAAPLVGCSKVSERRPPRTPGLLTVVVPPIVRHPWPDGRRLYLSEDHGVPLVAIAVTVRGGYRGESPAQLGLTSLVASLVLEGLGGGDKAALLDRYGEYGTTPLAWAEPDQLVLQCTVHRDDATAALRLMVETLRNPSLLPDALLRVRREQRETLMADRGIPDTVAGLGLLLGTLGLDPPVAALAEGTPHSLAGLTLADVHTWLDAHVRPHALGFAMAGDVSPTRARADVEAATQGWTAAHGEPVVTPPATESSGGGPRVVLVPWPGLPQAIVALGGSRAPYGHPDEPAQTLADSMFGSIANYELRSRLRASYGVQAKLWRTRTHPVRQLWAKVDGPESGAAIERLRGYLAQLRGEVQLTEASVQQTRRSALSVAMDRFHGPESALGRLIRLAADDLPPDAPKQRMSRLSKLTAPRVTTTMREIFDPDRTRLCVVGNSNVIAQARAVLPTENIIERTPERLVGIASPSVSA